MTHEVSVRESAARLSALFPELDPLIFEAFLTTGRTWNVLQSLGAKHYAGLGLTGNQLSTLRFLLLADDNGLTIGDIAAMLATNSTNVTKLVNRMERSGFVERITDSQDRRITWVELTAIGRDATSPPAVSQLDREAFGVVWEEQRVLMTCSPAYAKRHSTASGARNHLMSKLKALEHRGNVPDRGLGEGEPERQEATWRLAPRLRNHGHCGLNLPLRLSTGALGRGA